jgi:hypothetical protein
VREEAAKNGSWWREALAFWPLAIAVAVTAFFGHYTWELANQVTDQGGVRASRYEHFLHGRPNELGDTLAGFVGSLTLIWVVISVVQQSIELRAQRRELAEMVRAQDEQVRALRAQTEIFEDEKRRRDQVEVRNSLEELLAHLLTLLNQIRYLSWKIDFATGLIDIFPHGSDVPEIMEVDLSGLPAQLENTQHRLKMASIDSHLVGKPNLPPQLRQVLQLLGEIGSLKDHADNAMRIRANRWSVAQIASIIETFCRDSSLWSEEGFPSP